MTDRVAQAVNSARKAWRRGDFAACIAAVNAVNDHVAVKSPLGADALLLRSRARLRAKRPHEVVTELGPHLDEFQDIDECCTARMLYATAVARAVDAERGLAMLRELKATAHEANAGLYAEIAYYEALALWTLRRYDQSDALAATVEADRDSLLSVRATELRAYGAFARGRYHDALSLFRAARSAYESCRDADVELAAKIVSQIANLEQTLRSATIRGTHETPSSRIITDEVKGCSVKSMARLRLHQMDALLFALDGNAQVVYAQMRRSEESAPNEAWKIVALGNRALLAAWFDEPLAAEQFSEEALERARSLDWAATVGEERVGLLGLTEALCTTRPSAAASVLAVYDSGKSRDDALSAEPVDVIKAAWIVYVRGLVQRTRGEVIAARELLESAHRKFQAHGCFGARHSRSSNSMRRRLQQRCAETFTSKPPRCSCASTFRSRF